jgi:RNA polymerase sigma-70 factor (ECF subfamily)
MEYDIKHIVEGCIQNNQVCQNILFEKFYPLMFRISRKYTFNNHQAQDIVQLSFIKVFKQIHNYSLDNSLEGWIRRIVINTSIDETRKLKRRDTSTDIDIASLKMEDKEYNEDNLNTIMRAIDKLSPARKETFELYVLKEHSHKEIAELLGINEGTSKSNLFRAKAKLRDLLKNELIEEDFT